MIHVFGDSNRKILLEVDMAMKNFSVSHDKKFVEQLGFQAFVKLQLFLPHAEVLLLQSFPEDGWEYG